MNGSGLERASGVRKTGQAEGAHRPDAHCMVRPDVSTTNSAGRMSRLVLGGLVGWRLSVCLIRSEVWCSMTSHVGCS